MKHLAPGRLLFCLLLAAAAILLQAPDAFAYGDDIAVGGFSCSGGIASGNLFVSGASCPTTLSMDNVFSFLVCNMEQLAGNVMGAMYCGMVNNLAPAVLAAVGLATAIYGVMFLFGMIPTTGQEAMKFILKCAFIVGFATNADYIIGIAYRGAIGAISTGSSIAIGLMSADGVSSGADVYTHLDKFLSTMLHNATDMMAGVADPAQQCKNALFAVLGTMFVVFPMLAYLGLLLLGRIVMTLFRSVFAYIYAVVAITFILLLAPFFVTFALFKLTSNLFERWLGYLVSFALQVVLLFSFLAFVFSLHLEKTNVVTNLSAITMYKAEQAEATSFRLPFAYCTLCDFQVEDKDNPGTILKDTDPKYIENGKLVCKTPQTPVKPTFATSPDSKDELGSLITFAGNGIMSLIVLAMVIEHLLKLIPSLAQKLASNMNASYATQIGGGVNYYSRNSLDMPGQSLINDFNAGFNRGFENKGDGFTATTSGFKDGMAGLVLGRTTQKNADGSFKPIYNNTTEQQTEQGTGMGGAFRRWLSDPGKFGQ